MRVYALAVGVAIMMVAGTSAARAQDSFALEFRGGVAMPTEDLDNTALKTGAGFGATASYRVLPHLRLYGGWDWTHFVTEDVFASREYDVEPNGYAFGMQFQHPMANKVHGWLRAGGLYNHAELEDEDGDIVDSGHELGFEGGAGVRVALGDRFALTPGVRYRQFSADLEMPSGTIPVDIKFVSFEMGLAWSFGSPQPVATARK